MIYALFKSLPRCKISVDQQAFTLEGATMPDGQKYEDWLKSKDSGEDGRSGRGDG